MDKNLYASANSLRPLYDSKTYKFDKRLFSKSEVKHRITSIRSPHDKFMYVSLAMMCKSPTCENRIILRKMRIEKGGVVDLAQDENKKAGYKIKKIKKIKSCKKTIIQINPKFRDKAARIIQSWWIHMKNRYKEELMKIILIQKYWRGFWIRKYIYDMVYLNFLYVSFCQSLQRVIYRHKKRIAYQRIKYYDKEEADYEYARYKTENYKSSTYQLGRYEYYNIKEVNEYDEPEFINGYIDDYDYNHRNRYDFDSYKFEFKRRTSLKNLFRIFRLHRHRTMLKYLKKWRQVCWLMNKIDIESNKLYNIRNDKETKIVILSRYFAKWDYVTKFLYLQDQLEEAKGRNYKDSKYVNEEINQSSFRHKVSFEVDSNYNYPKDKKGSNQNEGKRRTQNNYQISNETETNIIGNINKNINNNSDYYRRPSASAFAQFFRRQQLEVYDVKGQPIKGNLFEFISKKGDIYDVKGNKITISPDEFKKNIGDIFDKNNRPIKQDLIQYIKNNKASPQIFNNNGKSLSSNLEDYIKQKANLNVIVKPDQKYYDANSKEIKGDLANYIKTKGDIYDKEGKKVSVDLDEAKPTFNELFDENQNPLKGDLINYIKRKGDVYDIKGNPVNVNLSEYKVTLNEFFDIDGKPIKGDLVEYIKREGDIYNKQGKKVKFDLTQYIKKPKTSLELYDKRGRLIKDDLVEYIKAKDDNFYDANGKKIKIDLQNYLNNNDVYDIRRRPIKKDTDLVQYIKTKGNIYDKQGKKIEIFLDQIQNQSNINDDIQKENLFYDKKGNEIKGDIIEYIRLKGDVYDIKGKPIQESDLEKVGIRKGSVFDIKGRPIRENLLNYIKHKGNIYDQNNRPIKLDLLELNKSPKTTKLYDRKGNQIKGDLIQYIKKGGDVYDEYGVKTQVNLENYGIRNGEVLDYRGNPIRGNLIEFIKRKGTIYNMEKQPISIDLDEVEKQADKVAVYDIRGNKIEGDLIEYIKTKGDIYDINGKPIKIDLDQEQKVIDNFYDMHGQPIKNDLLSFVKNKGDVYDVNGNKIEIDLNKYSLTFSNTFDNKGVPIKGDLIEYIKTKGDVYDKEGRVIKVDNQTIQNITNISNEIKKPKVEGDKYALKDQKYFDINGNQIKGDIIEYSKRFGDVYDINRNPVKIDIKEYKKYLPDVYDEKGKIIKEDLISYIKGKGNIYDIKGEKIKCDVAEYKKNRNDIYDKNCQLISDDFIEYINKNGEILNEKNQPIKTDLVTYIKNNGVIYNDEGKVIGSSLANYIKNNKTNSLYDINNNKIKGDLIGHIKNNYNFYDKNGKEIKTDLLEVIKTNKCDLYNENNEIINDQIEDYIREKNGSQIFDANNKKIRGNLIIYLQTKGDIYDKNGKLIKLDKDEFTKINGEVYELNNKPISTDLLTFVRTNGDIYNKNNEKISNNLYNLIKNKYSNGVVYDNRGQPIKQDLATYIKRNKNNKIYDENHQEIKINIEEFRKKMCDFYDENGKSITNDLVTLIKNNENIYDKYGRKIDNDLVNYIKTKGDVYDENDKLIKDDLIAYIKNGGYVYNIEGKEIKVNEDDFKALNQKAYDLRGNLIKGDLISYIRKNNNIYDINKNNINSDLEKIIRTKGDVFNEKGIPIRQDLLTYIKNQGEIYNYEGVPIKADLDEYKKDNLETYDSKGLPTKGDIVNLIRTKGEIFDKNNNSLNDDLEVYIRSKAFPDLTISSATKDLKDNNENVKKQADDKDVNSNKNEIKVKDDYIKYLNALIINGKLKNLIKHKEKKIKEITRTYLYAWLKKVLNSKNQKIKELEDLKLNKDLEYDEKAIKNKRIRNKIFRALLTNIDRRQKQRICQRYFNKYYKQIIAILNKENKKKFKDGKGKNTTFQIENKNDLEQLIRQSQRLSMQDKSDRSKIDRMINNYKSNNNDLIQMTNINDINDNYYNKNSKNIFYDKEAQLKNMSSANQACYHFQNFCHRSTHKDPLNSIYLKVIEEYKKSKLINLLNIYGGSKEYLLRKYFMILKNKCIGKRQKDLLSKMFAKLLLITMNYCRKKRLANKFNKWKRKAEILSSLYENYDNSNRLLGLEPIITRLNIRKNGRYFIEKLNLTKGEFYKTKLLRSLYNYRVRIYYNLLRKYFYKWIRNLCNKRYKLMKAKLIFRIFGRLNLTSEYDDKQLLSKYFNKWYYNIIKDDIKHLNDLNYAFKNDIVNIEMIKAIIIRGVIKRADKSISYYNVRNAFRKWNDITKRDKDPVLQAKTHLLKHNLNLNVEDFLNKLSRISNNRLKYLLLCKLIPKRIKFDKLKLLKYFLIWKAKASAIKGEDIKNALRNKIILIFLIKNDKQNLMKALNKWKIEAKIANKNDQDNEKLFNSRKYPLYMGILLLKKYLIRQPFKTFLKNLKFLDKKTLQNKGQILGDKLESILYKKPFDNLIKNMRQKIIFKILSALFPELFNKYKMLNLREYFDIWRLSTNNFKERKKMQIGQWLKNMLNKQLDEERNKEKDEYYQKLSQDYEEFNNKNNLQKRQYLLRILIERLINADKGNLKFPFKYWKIITKEMTKERNAKIIQEFCRGALYYIAEDKFNNGQKLKKLINYLYFNKLIKDLKEIGYNYIIPMQKGLKNCNDIHKKYTLNDMVAYYKYPKKLKLLILIIKKKINEDNSNLLEKYFNKWKNNKNSDIWKIIKIQAFIRKLLAKKKLDILRKIREKLLYLYLNNNTTINGLLKFRLLKWRQKCKELEEEECAQIIQKFIRNYRIQCLDKKIFNFFNKNIKKLIGKKLNNLAKLYLLKKGILRIPFKNLIKQLISNIKRQKFIAFLIKRTNLLDNNHRYDIKQKYFDKWKRIVEHIKIREECASIIIQSAFRGYLLRKIFNKDKRIREILIKIFLRNANDNLKIPTAFYKWVLIIQKLELNENAEIIQKFCRKVSEMNKQKLKEDKDNAYKNLATIIGNTKINLGFVFDKLKEIRRNKIFEELLNKLNDKRLDNLKEAFDNIKYYPEIMKLKKLLNLLDPFRLRKLRNAMRKWNNKSSNNKFILYFFLKIIQKLEDSLNIDLKLCFRKWALNAKKLYQMEQAEIISEFCYRNFNAYKRLQDWLRLGNKLGNKQSLSEIKDILKKLHYFIALSKLKKPIVRHAQKAVIDGLKKNKLFQLFLDKIKELIGYLDGNNNNSLLRKYFNKWKNITDKINEKNNALKTLTDTLDIKHKKISSNIYNAISLYKRFIHDYDKCLLKIAFNKIMDFGLYNHRYNRLEQDLLKDKEDLQNKQRDRILTKIYKIFYYKILDNFYNKINALRKQKLKPTLTMLINYMKSKLFEKISYDYNCNRDRVITPAKNKFTFRTKGDKDDNDLKNISFKKKTNYLTLCPFLINLINKLFKKKSSSTFKIIKKYSDERGFCKLYKLFNNKNIIKPKEDLLNELNKIILDKKLRKEALERLKEIMRKYLVYKITDALYKHVSLVRLFYLLKLSNLHKIIALQRFLRTILRKWRFIAFVKIMSKKKLELMYKNMHISYLGMMQEIFGNESGDKSINTSIIREFQRFGEGIGMWTNEDPETSKETLQFYKQETRAYVLDSNIKPYTKKRPSYVRTTEDDAKGNMETNNYFSNNSNAYDNNNYFNNYTSNNNYYTNETNNSNNNNNSNSLGYIKRNKNKYRNDTENYINTGSNYNNIGTIESDKDKDSNNYNYTSNNTNNYKSTSRYGRHSKSGLHRTTGGYRTKSNI